MKNENVAAAIQGLMTQMQPDIAQRNEEMNMLDRVIYEDGLYEGLSFPDGVDVTMYNYLRRTVDVHRSQLMGRGFQIYSTYNKEDLEDVEQQEAPEAPGPEEQEQPEPGKLYELAKLKNKKLQRNADTRKKLVDSIIRDNGGMAVFKHGATIGSSYGMTVYKLWLDKKNKKVSYSLLETPQNYYPGWADSNFRERDWDAYVYQISVTKAYRDYGKYLEEGKDFSLSPMGEPIGDGNTAKPLGNVTPLGNASPNEDDTAKQKMVTVIDFTGILPGYAGEKGALKEVDRGKETPVSVMIVGGCVCQVITEEKYLPSYYVINNIQEPRRSSGKSDITQSAIDINRSLIETMSTWKTIFDKEISPVYKAKGYEGATIPRRKPKQTTFIPMSVEQDIEPLNAPQAFGAQSEQLISELKDSFVRVTGIGRVLFDDPTINPTSNQALMTTLKGVIDIVEDKQSRWEPALINMFTDALQLAGELDKTIKEVVSEDGWNLYVQWPSVLRREDNSYQQMWLNRLTMGTTSLGSYLEAMGVDDVSEEIDRIRDEMQNPVTAAILSKSLGMLAQNVISPPTAPGPDVKVSLRGDLTPYQEANLASQQGFNEGPFPPTAGPQGNQGLMAQENADNPDFLTAPAFQGGTPIQRGTDGQPVQDQATPVLTTDQNTGQTASMPGSGQAQPVSTEGAMNQMVQRNGG